MLTPVFGVCTLGVCLGTRAPLLVSSAAVVARALEDADGAIQALSVNAIPLIEAVLTFDELVSGAIVRNPTS